VLLFLHADTVFPEGGLAAIVSALAASPDCIGGNFRLLFDGGDRFSRWLQAFTIGSAAAGCTMAIPESLSATIPIVRRVASARSP
jgi:hypothetical protein